MGNLYTKEVKLDEFGNPDGVIHNDDSKILIFTTKKYKITCERKFTIDNKGIIIYQS